MSSAKPKSIRAIRQLRKKAPKLIEPPRKTLIVRGNKTSDEVMSFLKNMRSLRKERSVMYSRKHQIYPFEDYSEIEQYCQKTAASLFLFGSHSKKRPHNIVLGRTYEHKVMDIVEMGISGVKSIEELVDNCNIPSNCRPFLVFQGDVWETEETYKKLRNLFNDFFFQNHKVSGIEISQMMRVVMAFTVVDKPGQKKTILMRVYEVTVEGNQVLTEDSSDHKLVMEELGPNVEFTLRRSKFADSDLWKKATHVPKPKKKKQKKNILYDGVGDERRKLYVDHQELKVLPLKKRKMIHKDLKRTKPVTQKLGEKKHEDQFGN